MKLVVLANRAASSINWRGALIEDALCAARPAIGGAPGRDAERAPALAAASGSAPGLPEAGTGKIRAAAPT
jgi:hypothetical protein